MTWLDEIERAACAEYAAAELAGFRSDHVRRLVVATRAAEKLVADAYGEKWSDLSDVYRAIDELKAVLG